MDVFKSGRYIRPMSDYEKDRRAAHFVAKVLGIEMTRKDSPQDIFDLFEETVHFD